MPKSIAPSSHEAIKRSLKSKFKLILSENRILVETINGYVRKAEKVYKEMESTADVTPKQFNKAMEKLERAYSACVRLIMVASDLFEKGDTDSAKLRDTGASSCESETSVYSSESSATITDSNRARKTAKDKASQKRSKSTDVNEQKVKAKPQSANRKNHTTELADMSKKDSSDRSQTETSNAASERLFVRPGSGSDFDHIIELQRFLHGLEKEKLQTDHPSPCSAQEKQLLSYKSQAEKATAYGQSEEEEKQASPEESPSQSLSQRLKILKSAIEHFKDRSLGDERVTQVLNDIRELVLMSRDHKEMRSHDQLPEVEAKEDILSQTSLVSESISTEIRQDIDEKDCSKDKGERNQSFLDEQKNESPIKMKPSSPVLGKLQHGSVDGSAGQRSPLASDWGQKSIHSQQNQAGHQKQHSQNTEQREMDGNRTIVSPGPFISPQTSEDDKNDINQILVNRIVDMVSSKLVPRLQMKNEEDKHRSRNLSESSGPEQEAVFPKHIRASPLYVCHEMTFPTNQQQTNCCGNYNHLVQLNRHRYQQQLGQQQHQELQKMQRRQQRPKVVSFVEDYACGSTYSTWNDRPLTERRTFDRDSSPSSHASSPYLYSDCEERPQVSQLQQGSTFTSPHKKRLHTIQIPPTSQRYSEQQQQCPTLHRKLNGKEEIDAIDIDVELLNKEDDESERENDTENEPLKEHAQYQPQDIHSKTTPKHQPITWRSRSVQKSPSFLEAEYKTMQASQRGQLYRQQKPLHKTDSFVHRFSSRSPTDESRQNHMKDSLYDDWLSPVIQAADSTAFDGSKLRPIEVDTDIQYRLSEKLSSELRQGDFSVKKSSSLDDHSEWAHSELAPASTGTQSQPKAEISRQYPTKAPRSSTPQSHRLSSSYNNITEDPCGFIKLSNDSMFQNSGSSCETSPLFLQDVRSQIHNILKGNNIEDPDNTDKVPTRPEVVCIDSTQLQADASRTITLSNLPLDLEETELLNIFKKFGQVTKIYFIKDRHTGVFQGRAYGKFSKASEAYLAAQELQKLVIDDHQISVQLYVSTP